MSKVSGSIRFNTDSSKLEIYNGEQWWEIDSTSPDLQTGGTRALFGGGYRDSPGPNSFLADISFVNLDSAGDGTDFGDLAATTRGVDGLASRTRGVFTGGYEPGYSNRMQFVTIASTGDATDFGDLAVKARTGGGCGSPTRGIVIGGRGVPADIKTIQYFTISTQGNGSVFGDLSTTCNGGSGASNAVRGLCHLGGGDSVDNDEVEFITIATLGDAVDFGNLLIPRNSASGAASGVRAAFAGGNKPSPAGSANQIEYFDTFEHHHIGQP